MGASRFGLRCLDAIRVQGSVDLSGVLTVPQTFPISYAPQGVSLSNYGDFTSYAKAHEIPCHCMQGSMHDSEVDEFIMATRPDCLIVVGWYHLLPDSILDICPAYGLHASLLPDYSGGAPLVWAIINGETRTGITLFQMKSGVDNGPIVGSRDTDITNSDTIATLYDRIEILGTELLVEHLTSMADGSVVAVPQNESNRRIFPQRTPDDGEIDWSGSARQIYNFIRAQTRPYPGAFTICRGERVTLWDAECCEDLVLEDPPPSGAVLQISDGSIIVMCGDGLALKLGIVTSGEQDQDAAQWHGDLLAEESDPVNFQSSTH